MKNSQVSGLRTLGCFHVFSNLPVKPASRLRAKRRFLKFARKSLPYLKNFTKSIKFKALISAQALYFLEVSCKTRSHIQMKISRTTKSDRVSLKAHANYPNARPNELLCSSSKAASITVFPKKDAKRSHRRRRFWI